MVYDVFNNKEIHNLQIQTNSIYSGCNANKIRGGKIMNEQKKFDYGPVILFFIASTLLLLVNGGN